VSLIALRTLTNFGRTLGTMLSIGSGVEIASLHHSGRNEDVQRHLMTMGAALSLFTTVTAVAILAFGSPFVALWTGRGDLFDLPIVASLLAAILVAGPTAPLVAHAMLADGSRSLALAQIAQLIIGFMACLLLIPTLGARGAAFALAGAEIIGTGLLLPWLLGRSLNGLSYLAYASSCARTTLAAGVWSLATAALATRLVAPHGVFGLLASGAVWALIGPLPLLLYAAGSERRSRVYARVRLGLGSALSSRAKPETVAGAAAVGRDGRP
jgi:O-antigen/teichoic acid export membrane protein